jgi:hypothetical protein
MEEPGLHDSLVLLNVFQTCWNKGVSFWKFLLSKQTNIEEFASGVSSHHCGLELFPAGFEPLHPATGRASGTLECSRWARL